MAGIYLWIILGIGLSILFVFFVIFFVKKYKKREEDPTILRARNLVVKLNQEIFSF